MKVCPNCNFLNTDSSEKCKCGYVFKPKTIKANIIDIDRIYIEDCPINSLPEYYKNFIDEQTHMLYIIIDYKDGRSIRKLVKKRVWDEKKLCVDALKSAPKNIAFDEENLPYSKNRKIGWGKRFNAFVCLDSKYYHRRNCPCLINKQKNILHIYNAMCEYEPCPICFPKADIDKWYIKYINILKPIHKNALRENIRLNSIDPFNNIVGTYIPYNTLDNEAISFIQDNELFSFSNILGSKIINNYVSKYEWTNKKNNIIIMKRVKRIILIAVALIIFISGIILIANYNVSKELEDMNIRSSASTIAENVSDMVYYTPNGSSYHRQDCKTLLRSKKILTTTKENAHQKNLSPCSVCNPPQ